MSEMAALRCGFLRAFMPAGEFIYSTDRANLPLNPQNHLDLRRAMLRWPSKERA